MTKQQYRPHSHIYDTSWLPEGISISNNDLTIVHGKNANRCELKYRTPILSYAQKIEYNAYSFHVVVHYGRNITEAGVNFDSDHFDIYCPYQEHDFVRVPRGWLLVGDCHTVAREQAIQILCAFEPFSCCQKYTIYKGKRT